MPLDNFLIGNKHTHTHTNTHTHTPTHTHTRAVVHTIDRP